MGLLSNRLIALGTATFSEPHLTVKKPVVAILVLMALAVAFVALERPPPAPVSRAPTTAQPPTGPFSAVPDTPDEAEPPMSIPDIADTVAPPPPAPAGARATIVSPVNGATVLPTFTLKMAVTGLTLAPAGSEDPRAGHFHVLVDTPPATPGGPITRDAHHLDVGSGEPEVDVELPPGKHTLQLLIGDGNHVPHHPPVLSERIEILVGADGA